MRNFRIDSIPYTTLLLTSDGKENRDSTSPIQRATQPIIMAAAKKGLRQSAPLYFRLMETRSTSDPWWVETCWTLPEIIP